MEKIKTTILLAVILLLSAGTASAGISVSVTPMTPGSDTVSPGGTAKYTLTVSLDPDESDLTHTENVNLFVSSPPTDWTYTFNPNLFDMVQSETRTVNLDVYVAANTEPATYIRQGDVSTTDALLQIPDFSTTTYVVTTTAIPEFPTVALPIVSVIGLMLLFHKRKHN
jgi:hypothetical protein